MIVRCIRNRGTDLPRFEQTGAFYTDGTLFPVTLGRDYDVFGLVLFHGGLMVLVDLDGNAQPVWLPVQLFEVKDPAMPAHWEFNAGTDDESVALGLEARWGYHALVTGTAHYLGLIERDPAALTRYAAERRSN